MAGLSMDGHIQCMCNGVHVHVGQVFAHLHVHVVIRLQLCMYMKKSNTQCQKEKVQTLDSCFRLLALVSRVQHNLSLALLGVSSP